MFPVQESPFAAFVRHELQERRQSGRRLGLHEGLALLGQHLWAFAQEVWKGPRKRRDGLLLIPLYELAATCQRVAEDCFLLSPEL